MLCNTLSTTDNIIRNVTKFYLRHSENTGAKRQLKTKGQRYFQNIGNVGGVGRKRDTALFYSP